jgi:hypothetical protein
VDQIVAYYRFVLADRRSAPSQPFQTRE